jgi:DNA-nicking Smr family endonuclease
VVKKKNNHSLDTLLFQQEMDGVVPLKNTATTDSKPAKTRFRTRKPEMDTNDFIQPQPPPMQSPAQIKINEDSSHRKNGVQKRILQKLKRGQFPIGDQLDLHHMNTQTGQKVLLEFIADAQSNAFKCVRIIHGKGLRSEYGPKLRIMTRQVLRDHPQVLAFNACKPADGGSGAMDVLLKTL